MLSLWEWQKPQGNRMSGVESGLIRGESAAQEKCAAKRGFCGGAGLAWVAQLVERVLGKDEVTGSIPVPGSRN
jgi:hypothetical protein